MCCCHWWQFCGLIVNERIGNLSILLTYVPRYSHHQELRILGKNTLPLFGVVGTSVLWLGTFLLTSHWKLGPSLVLALAVVKAKASHGFLCPMRYTWPFVCLVLLSLVTFCGWPGTYRAEVLHPLLQEDAHFSHR